MTSIASLEPRILHILTAPGIDLSTISAKRVRKQLLLADPTLSPEWIQDNKAEVDILIGNVFEQVSEDVEEREKSSSPKKRKATVTSSPTKAESDDGGPPMTQEDLDDDFRAEENGDTDDTANTTPSESPSPAKKPKFKASSAPKREVSDEDYARQLQAQMNGAGHRASRSGNAGPSTKKSKSKTKRKEHKSAATIDSDGSGDDAVPSKTKKKRRSSAPGENGPAKGGFMKEFALRQVICLYAQNVSHIKLVIANHWRLYLLLSDYQDRRW